MSHSAISHRPVHGYHPLQAVLATLGRLRRELAVWSARRRSRAQLLTFGEHELQDIGISRAQAFYEHEKPFWRG